MPRKVSARALVASLALAWGLSPVAPAAAQEAPGPPQRTVGSTLQQPFPPEVPGAFACPPSCTLDQPPLTLDRLVHMSRSELEQLYEQSDPGPIPEGYARGKSITYPGTALAAPLAKLSGVLWRGKVFAPADGTLVNQWRGFRAIRARVAYGPSWRDGQPAIVMDYGGSSRLVWADVRDEMRQVAPGLFLGIMYRRQDGQPRFVRFFALDACP